MQFSIIKETDFISTKAAFKNAVFNYKAILCCTVFSIRVVSKNIKNKEELYTVQ